jgi:hypothetical protein
VELGEQPRGRRIAAGVALIVIGLVLYALKEWDGLTEGAVPLIIGSVFLAFYFYTRNFGLLIPGAIMSGLGIGLVLEESLRSPGNFVLIGLGGGFVTISLVALLYERKNQWWALIPGGVLLLLGFPDTQDIVRALFENWPLILVAVGVLILLGGLLRSRAGAGSE